MKNEYDIKFLLDESISKKLFDILKKTAIFMHPDIVKNIKDNNIILKEEIDNSYISDYIDVDHYLFPGSDCVFPGFKRNEGSWTNKFGRKRKHYYDGSSFFDVKNNDGVERDHRSILDDNIYPRQIWSILYNEKVYGSKAWKQNGVDKDKDTYLGQFELAHLESHKTNQDESKAEFTSASNIILIPKGLARPTDGVTKVLEDLLELKTKIYETSSFDEKEVNFFRPDNWENRLEFLHEYRRSELLKRIQYDNEVDLVKFNKLEGAKRKKPFFKGKI